MAGRPDDPKQKGRARKALESVEDWLAQRLAMLDDGGDDDDDASGAGEDDELYEDAPTVKARVVDPVPRTVRLGPPPRAKTIPPSRPGATIEPDGPRGAAPFQPEAEALPELEAVPLGTEDVEPLLTEEAEPIEAHPDTDEHRPAAPPRAETRTFAPDEAMWDLLGETTGSTRVPPEPERSASPDAPTEEGRSPKPAPSRSSLAPTIPPASIQVTPARVVAPTAIDAEPPVRRSPSDAGGGDPRVDALIAEAQTSPPRRRRTPSAGPPRTPAPAPAGASDAAAIGLVAGDTLTPEDSPSEASEPPSVTATSGFDEVFPISRGIPPVRARPSRPAADGANEKTSALLDTDGGTRSDPAASEPTTVARAADESSEPGTQWLSPGEAAAEETQIRPSLAETALRPGERQRGPTPATSGPDDPTRAPFPAVQAAASSDAAAPTAITRAAGTAPLERRFYAPHLDDDDELAGTIPPEVSSAVITWGSVIVGVLMFFVTMVIFAMFVIPYLVVT